MCSENLRWSTYSKSDGTSRAVVTIRTRLTLSEK